MTRRGIFLADGSSDLPLARHLERLCADVGHEVLITAIDPRSSPDRTVAGRLRMLVVQEFPFDVVFVHRDAEGDDPQRRRREIADGAEAVGITSPVIPVVPVRMTEAWLLLDPAEIRRVAGRPNGRDPLDLPVPSEVERLADPKARLHQVLLDASGTRGRRRDRFQRDFGQHRALLLERLDLTGPVSRLQAWQHLRLDIDAALRR